VQAPYLLNGAVQYLCADACAGGLNVLQLHVDVVNGGLAADEALKVLLHLQGQETAVKAAA
jgi:hypothetical protein